MNENAKASPVLITELEKISKRKIKSILNDAQKTAAAINLVYVHDSQPGIKRVRKQAGFVYVTQKNKVTDDAELTRIKSLVIPPAWEDVWICHLQNGHLQATGIDAKKRKQYRYHPAWNSLRNHTKFYRMYDFGKSLPSMRLQLEKDLSIPGLPMAKVLAAMVSLMERTNIRVGNNFYEKLYGSFGLTTLKDKHVEIAGTRLRFHFKGKKGIHHDISINNRRLSAIVKKCRDIPGKELFQYLDEAGARKSIDSGMVNDYIKSISGGDFTAKDFRTWSGTISAFLAFRELGAFETVAEAKKKILQALDQVSSHLGNTRNVCKKYYVHPAILTLYESAELHKYIHQLDDIEIDDNKSDLTAAEKLVMKILERY